MVKKIARNPLLISIIAVVHEDGKSLPENRADLYEACIEFLLFRWDKYGRVRNKFSPDKKKEFLRVSAFYAHKNGKKELTREDIDEIARKHFPRLEIGLDRMDEFIEELWDRNYLLRPVSRGTYNFLHLSFQEYFAALELGHRTDGLDFILEHPHQSWWHEVILLYAGRKKDASELVTRIRALKDDMFYNNLFLCAKCVIDARFTELENKKDVVDLLANIYGRYRFIDMQIVYFLAKLDISKVKGFLKKEKYTDVRWRIVYALGSIGGDDVKRLLMELVKNEKDTEVRESIVDALGSIGGEDVKRLLMELVKNEKYTDVRRSIVYAIGDFGGEDVKRLLMELVKNEEDTDVRGRIVYALGDIGGEEEYDRILDILNSRKVSKPLKTSLLPALWKITLRIDKRVIFRGGKYMEMAPST